jgi:GTP-binding protein
VGLGHEFLRHIERTRVLIHVLDGSIADPLEAFQQINRELAEYDPELGLEPQLIAINKIDLPETQSQLTELQKAFRALGFDPLPVSGVTREGIDILMSRTAALLRERARTFEEAYEELEVIVPKPPADRFEIERKRRTFYVRGENVERLVVMTDMESEEGVYRLQRRLKRMGVFQALSKAGAEEGSRILIGDAEFSWDSSYEPLAKPVNTRTKAAARKGGS